MNKLEYIFNFILSLFPQGLLWNFGERFRTFLRIIAKELVKIKEYADNFSIESNPFLAKDTIPEWLEQYGIVSANDFVSNENLVIIYANAIGGSSIHYLSNLLKNRYPDLKIQWSNNYDTATLLGVVDNLKEQLMLYDFLEKVFPAYVMLIVNTDVVEDYGQYAMCGIAITGVATCGFIIDDSALFLDGRYANCGIAQTGVATCGNEYNTII